MAVRPSLDLQGRAGEEAFDWQPPASDEAIVCKEGIKIEVLEWVQSVSRAVACPTAHDNLGTYEECAVTPVTQIRLRGNGGGDECGRPRRRLSDRVSCTIMRSQQQRRRKNGVHDDLTLTWGRHTDLRRVEHAPG